VQAALHGNNVAEDKRKAMPRQAGYVSNSKICTINMFLLTLQMCLGDLVTPLVKCL
jgi:hypothetical protein